jgi:hypothetical protein
MSRLNPQFIYTSWKISSGNLNRNYLRKITVKSSISEFLARLDEGGTPASCGRETSEWGEVGEDHGSLYGFWKLFVNSSLLVVQVCFVLMLYPHTTDPIQPPGSHLQQQL